MRRARRALISVHSKEGIEAFARGLAGLGVEIVSTGGTAAVLRRAGIGVTEVASFTGSPEILGGRVKTLHPKIHAGILAGRDNEAHRLEMERLGWDAIDVVAVNLPAPASGGDEAAAALLDSMDIGGHALLRAAAKNCRDVIVVSNPARYAIVLDELKANDGTVSEGLRLRLAREALETAARYDGSCARALGALLAPAAGGMPPEIVLELGKMEDLRYGENPHQRAALYRTAEGDEPSAVGGNLLGGKPLSYNNYLDLDAALAVVKEFRRAACAIVKHTNPCGVAIATTAEAAYRRARETDPQSAFGGIVACNATVDAAAAAAIAETFTECVAAPAFTDEALDALAGKASLRLIEIPELAAWIDGGARRRRGRDLRTITGGLLAQERDVATIGPGDLRCVTRRAPAAAEAAAIFFAWAVVRHVRSNAVVIATAEETVGIGAGQMSRVDAARLAVGKAAKPIEGCVAASDGFFPFADAVEELARAGVRTIVQPGGSRRDGEVVAACDALGVAMLFTGMRCFRH
ncbi:MAG: bifunctional phosphoribosylaminoimidazolecarboxamide formyltransferase/IMP cyclohydrolase [bacterium]|nr:bifunctional phosphoribosylaminoimidazolecarboxamide formyltransferase/IMP cyclohydrolase [bacterium]